MRIEIVNVGPRDGLQNEDKTLSPEVRAELCVTGWRRRVEGRSRQLRTPQARAADGGCRGGDGRYRALPGHELRGVGLNEKGYERAVESGVD